jgi:general secretion pathway protein D
VNGGRIGQQAEAGPTNLGALTVDPGGNRLLFRGTPSQFERLRVTLQQLDTPPQQVLIEITVAEVTLTDETRFGVEWYLERALDDGALRATTAGGSTRQNGGLGVVASQVFSRGRVEAALNAFASNRNLNILSTPRLVTRSGGVGEFLVGTDVPIITSQRASNNQTGGDTDVLQTVQYRQTGVILNVRPVVYGDGRIDIELYQEVSSQQPNDSADINSPLILNRAVTTQVSLEEGMTAVIGGIMQDNYSREQRGVPGLKDLPFIGSAFRSDTVSGDKVELVILVTPYIIRDSEDMQDMTEAMTSSMNATLSRRGTQVYTLYPWSRPFGEGVDHNAAGLRQARRGEQDQGPQE